MQQGIVIQSDVNAYMTQLGQAARDASTLVAGAPTADKNAALDAIADSLLENESAILKANALDLQAGKQNDLSSALMDRLALNTERVAAMAEGCRQVAKLPDPVGAVTDMTYRPSGIQVGKMRVPLGVIGIVYESRPNVTVDAAILCLKSGNAVILRGGSEAINSNLAIARCISRGLEKAGLPAHSIQVVETTDRSAVGQLITMPEYVDIVVPRGGKGLIERISREATVPVIKHLDGLCHVYIDDDADLQMALDVGLERQDPSLWHLRCHGNPAGSGERGAGGAPGPVPALH